MYSTPTISQSVDIKLPLKRNSYTHTCKAEKSLQVVCLRSNPGKQSSVMCVYPRMIRSSIYSCKCREAKQSEDEEACNCYDAGASRADGLVM